MLTLQQWPNLLLEFRRGFVERVVVSDEVEIQRLRSQP